MEITSRFGWCDMDVAARLSGELPQNRPLSMSTIMRLKFHFAYSVPSQSPSITMT